MTRLLTFGVMLAALAACTPSSAPALETNAPADLQAVETLRTAVASAYTVGNAEALSRLYTLNAVSMGNGQKTVTGRAAILTAQQELLSQFKVKMDLVPDETWTMGATGFDRGRYVLTLTPKAGGEAMRSEGRYLVLLEKGPDGWRISHDIDNSATPVAPMSAPPVTTPN